MDHDDQGYQLLGDNKIIQAVTEANTGDAVENHMEDSDDGEEAHTPSIPLHGKVVDMLMKCLLLVEQQSEATTQHLFIFKNLMEMAVAKRYSSLKQTKITSFFS